jgi:hypothetical protein
MTVKVSLTSKTTAIRPVFITMCQWSPNTIYCHPASFYDKYYPENNGYYFAPMLVILVLALGFIPFLYTYVQGQSILTYENPTYGIEMQYPSSWDKDLNVSSPDLVTFYPSGVNSNPSLTVTVDDISDEKGIPLAQYASDSNDAIKHETTNFKLLGSTTNNTLAGIPAYKSIYSYAGNSQPIEGMEVGAIKGDKVYIFTYEAGPNEYSVYLPTVQNMINSFQITNQSQVQQPLSQLSLHDQICDAYHSKAVKLLAALLPFAHIASGGTTALIMGAAALYCGGGSSNSLLNLLP